MHDPMLLTDEHATEIQGVYNRCLDRLFTMLIVDHAPPYMSVADMRDLMTAPGGYSDYR